MQTCYEGMGQYYLAVFGEHTQGTGTSGQACQRPIHKPVQPMRIILMSYLRTRRGSLWGRDAAMVKVIVAVRTVLAVVERHAARCGSHATRDMMQPLHGVSLT